MISLRSASLRLLLICSLIMAVPSSAQQAEDPAQALMDSARQFLTYGRSEKNHNKSRRALKMAETQFRDFLRTYDNHPDRKEALYRMALSQLLTGNIDSAEANFDSMINAYRTGHWVGAAAYRMGVQNFNKGYYKSATPYFRIASRQYEKSHLAELALYQYSRCLLLTEQLDTAIAPLKQLSNTETVYADNSRLALAKIYIQKKDFDQAIPILESLTGVDGVDATVLNDAYVQYGLTLANTGQREKALEILNRVMQEPAVSSENKSRAQKELVQIFYQEGDYDSIIAQYDRGLIPGETLPTAQMYLYAGYALMKKGHTNRAINAFNTVETIRPGTKEGYEACYRRLYCYYQAQSGAVSSQADALYNVYKDVKGFTAWQKMAKVYKAETLYHTNQLTEAATTYKLIDSEELPVSLQPNFLYKKLIALHDAEDYRRSVKSANAFLNSFPNHKLAHEVRVRRGSALLASENRAGAAEDFEFILEEAPESSLTAIALQGLIKIYSKDNRYAELQEACELLIGKFPALKQLPRAHAHYWLGWAHFKQEQFDRALAPLEEARKLAPDYYKEAAGTRILYATYYLRDSDKMAESYTRLLQDVPGKYFPPKMLAWLGIQAYQNENYLTAQKVLSEIVDLSRPEQTPIEVLRFLSKSYLQNDQYANSKQVAKIVLNMEESTFWKADTLLDIANTELGLGQLDKCIANAKEALYFEPKGTIESSLRFTIAEAYALQGNTQAAKTEYLLVASQFDGDPAIHPLALWKTAQLLKNSDPDASAALLSTQQQKYPDWNAPK